MDYSKDMLKHSVKHCEAMMFHKMALRRPNHSRVGIQVMMSMCDTNAHWHAPFVQHPKR